MSNRHNKFNFVKLTLVRLFPILRHLRHAHIQRKIDRNWRRHYSGVIRRSLEGALRPPPPLVTAKKPGGYLIEVTNACNLRCPMCSTHLSKKPKSHMPLTVLEQVFDRMTEEGAMACSLHTVGETFVYPHLHAAVELAQRKGIRVGISTNANFPQKIRELHEAFPVSINAFRFSIDAVSKQVYEVVRKRGRIERVMECCEWVAQKNHGRRQGNIGLTIDCVLSEDNVGEIATFCRTFSRYTFMKDIRFGLVNSLAPTNDYYDAKRPKFDSLFCAKPGCSMPFGLVNFNNRGEISVCCRDYDDELVIGNALEHSIQEIWHSEKAESLRRQHRGEAELTVKQCLTCFGPRPGVSGAVNSFLHSLWYLAAAEDDGAWRKRIIDFMSDLNDFYADLATRDSGDIDALLSRHLS